MLFVIGLVVFSITINLFYSFEIIRIKDIILFVRKEACYEFGFDKRKMDLLHISREEVAVIRK